MKCILISVLGFILLPYITDANWCIKQTTINSKITKVLTKVRTSRKWYGGIRRQTISYIVTELLPRTRQHRVCCEGYTLDSVHRICEPNCPVGCPQFSGCVKPNTCECHNGYRMKGDSCEPICEPSCSANAFCSSPNVCLCKSGFEYNDLTKSCDSIIRTTLPSMTISPLADRTTIVRVIANTTTSTTPPSTEITRMIFERSSTESRTLSDSPSTETTRTSDIESSLAPKQTTSKGRNATCIHLYSCGNSEPCRLKPHCKCNDGYVKVDSSCHLKFGLKPDDDECIEESLCRGLTTGEYATSTEQISSSEGPETSTIFASTEDVSSNCESECTNGLCIDGLCQCPKGSFFSLKSNGCIINSSCEMICQNGICQEDGVCECLQGFVYQYDKGCVPNCDKKCINGICSSPNVCLCKSGFEYNDLTKSCDSSLRTTLPSMTISPLADRTTIIRVIANTTTSTTPPSTEITRLIFERSSTESRTLSDSPSTETTRTSDIESSLAPKQTTSKGRNATSKGRNGICQEDGVCECLQGFVYQYDKGCVPNCDPKCINGICIASGKCQCLDGFHHNHENLFECVPVGKLSEKLKKLDNLDFPWIWVVLTILVIAVLGMFIIMKKSRKHNYNVDKIEEARHIVHFESKCV